MTSHRDNRISIEELLLLLKEMTDEGASSSDIDREIDKHNPNPEDRSYLIRMTQEYEISHIKKEEEDQKRLIRNILLALAIACLIAFMLASGGLVNFLNSLFSPVSFILVFFGYQLFKNNRRLRRK